MSIDYPRTTVLNMRSLQGMVWLHEDEAAPSTSASQSTDIYVAAAHCTNTPQQNQPFHFKRLRRGTRPFWTVERKMKLVHKCARKNNSAFWWFLIVYSCSQMSDGGSCKMMFLRKPLPQSRISPTSDICSGRLDCRLSLVTVFESNLCACSQFLYLWPRYKCFAILFQIRFQEQAFFSFFFREGCYCDRFEIKRHTFRASRYTVTTPESERLRNPKLGLRTTHLISN